MKFGVSKLDVDGVLGMSNLVAMVARAWEVFSKRGAVSCCLSFLRGLAPVVQRVNSVIQWINCYPVMKYVGKTRYSHMNLMLNEDESIKISQKSRQKHQTEYFGSTG